MQQKTLLRSMYTYCSIAVLFIMSNIPVCTASPAGRQFYLSIENQVIEARYPDQIHRTRITKISANWIENLTAYLQGGLRLSYLDVNHSSNPATIDTSSTGEGAGITLSTPLLNTTLARLALSFDYDYYNTESDTSAPKSEYQWHTIKSSIDLSLFPRANVSLLAGISLSRMNGEQQDSGTINRMISFHEDNALGYYGGIGLRTDPSGQINLSWHGGHSSGFSILFSRRY